MKKAHPRSRLSTGSTLLSSTLHGPPTLSLTCPCPLGAPAHLPGPHPCSKAVILNPQQMYFSNNLCAIAMTCALKPMAANTEQQTSVGAVKGQETTCLRLLPLVFLFPIKVMCISSLLSVVGFPAIISMAWQSYLPVCCRMHHEDMTEAERKTAEATEAAGLLCHSHRSAEELQ